MKSLLINFRLPPEQQLVADHNWIRLERVKKKSDTASISETAALIDAAYQTDPCNPAAAGRPVDQDKFHKIVQDTLDLSLCDADPSANKNINNSRTHIKIKVILSDPDTTYVLRLTGDAKMGVATTVMENVSLRLPIKNKSSLLLPWPVFDQPVFGWSGFVYGKNGIVIAPKIILSGNTLNFGEKLIGILTANYTTKYYVVEINFNDLSCLVRCFAMDLIATLRLQRPPEQGSVLDWKKYCAPANYIPPEPDQLPLPDGVTCYELVRLSVRCECDVDVESSFAIVHRPVTCPDGFIQPDTAPGDYPVSGRFGTNEIAGYRYCPPIERPWWTPREANETDISKPAFYKKICCKDLPRGMVLPHCPVVTLKNSGGVEIEKGADYYQKEYGQNVQLIPVSPNDNDCGVTVIKQNLYQHNCCDGVTPIYFDEVNSTEIIADNSKGLVTVTGGRAPYHWQIRGSGFWANAACTWRDVETDGPGLWIYTKDSCGVCYVWCNDGCSDQSWTIRSDVGQWVQINSDTDTSNCVGVQLDCGPVPQLYENDCIQGKYKIKDYWGSNYTYCPNPADSTEASANIICAGSLAAQGPKVPSCGFGPPVVNLISDNPLVGSGTCGDDSANFWQHISYAPHTCYNSSTNTLSTSYFRVVYHTGSEVYEWRC